MNIPSPAPEKLQSHSPCLCSACTPLPAKPAPCMLECHAVPVHGRHPVAVLSMVAWLQVAKEYMSTMGTPKVRARLQAGAHPPSLAGAHSVLASLTYPTDGQ